MSAVERRRAPRARFFKPEPAVVHLAGHDIPVHLIDLSRTGALLSCGSSIPVENRIPSRDRLQLSMQDGASVFQLEARIVRTTMEHLAIEFLEGANSNKLDLKMSVISAVSN